MMIGGRNSFIVLLLLVLLVWLGFTIYLHEHNELHFLSKTYLDTPLAHTAQKVASALLTAAVSPEIEKVIEAELQYEVQNHERNTKAQTNTNTNTHNHESFGTDANTNANTNTGKTNEIPEKTDLHPSQLHIIFSTDCSDYQNWQSITLMYSALLVGQTGKLTRIASGCSNDEIMKLNNVYKKLYPEYFRLQDEDNNLLPLHSVIDADGNGNENKGSSIVFRVHYTPDFKHDKKSNRKYAFYNKPRGVSQVTHHTYQPFQPFQPFPPFFFFSFPFFLCVLLCPIPLLWCDCLDVI